MSTTKINKVQAGEGIWTADNLVAGTNISITQIEKPVIDANTLGVWHFDNDFNNAVQSSQYTFTEASKTYVSFATPKFGSNGLEIRTSDGSSAQRKIITFPEYVGTNNITVDWWLYYTDGNAAEFGLGDNYRPYGFTISYYGTSDVARAFYSNSQYVSLNSSQFVYNSWNHMAIERANGYARWYVNGKLIHSQQDTNNLSSVNSFYAYGSTSSNIDELRISNVGRYQGQDFTPYSQPYTAAGGPAQYQINNTKADPDLSSYLQNTATGSNSVTIAGIHSTASNSTNVGFSSSVQGNYTTAIGTGSTTASSHSSTALGANAYAAGNYSLSICSSGTVTATQAIGSESIAIGVAAIARADRAIAIGETSEATAQQAIAIGQSNQSTTKTQASGASAIAIGYNAKATATSAAQIGAGTNSTANTFQVFNYQLLDANGKVPSARLGVTRQKYTGVTGTTLATCLTLANYSTILVYKNGMLFDETDDYTISTNNIEFNIALESTDKITIIAM